MHSPSLNIGNYGLLCWNSPIASRYRQRHCLCCVEIVNSILPIVKLWKRTTARTLKLQTIPACKLLQTIDWRCPRCLRRKHGEGGNGARYHHPLWYLYSNRGGYLGSVNDERESLRTVRARQVVNGTPSQLVLWLAEIYELQWWFQIEEGILEALMMNEEEEEQEESGDEEQEEC